MTKMTMEAPRQGRRTTLDPAKLTLVLPTPSAAAEGILLLFR
ncbi:hypothetical protein [Consotaella salsifontis]|uniref:Uncharacterized protein n=1 Tax=Consotaella salsifontis TaxID=1365950 RepID=A0A1T4NRK9_9HYPH|nr:hypothetical protein [Consotaella salsifontis]SJZ81824.1 hypothetical protein SAMN05428963_103148 [Consotaella salsifontis]